MQKEDAHSRLLDFPGASEEDALEEPPKVSLTRAWFLLGVYSVCSICNAVVAYGFSAMILETQAVLPVLSDQQINILLSYASIVPVCAIVPTMWLLAGPNGLYRTLILGALTLVLGALLRLLPFVIAPIGESDGLTLALIHIGSIVNCICMTVFLTTPSAFSVAFFPDSQRTTATAVASTCFELGSAFVFLVPKITTDVTLFLSITLAASGACLVGMCFQPRAAVVPQVVREREMMPSVAEPSADGAVPVIYREVAEVKPEPEGLLVPRDPAAADTSKSPRARLSTLHAEEAAMPLLEELKLALSKRSFVAMALATSVVQGIWEGWTPLVPEELTYLSEDETDNIAFLASLGTICGGFIIGPIADRCCNQQLKSLLLLCLSGMCCLFAVFTFVMPLPGGALDSHDWAGGLRHSEAVLYLPMFGTGFFQGAIVPLAYEVLAEMSFPVSEGTSGGLLQIINNGCSLILIFVFGAGVSEEWFNLVQWIAMVVCLGCVALTKVSYGRGPQRMSMSKGAARSSVFSKNIFQQHDPALTTNHGLDRPLIENMDG